MVSLQICPHTHSIYPGTVLIQDHLTLEVGCQKLFPLMMCHPLLLPLSSVRIPLPPCLPLCPPLSFPIHEMKEEEGAVEASKRTEVCSPLLICCLRRPLYLTSWLGQPSLGKNTSHSLDPTLWFLFRSPLHVLFTWYRQAHYGQCYKSHIYFSP